VIKYLAEHPNAVPLNATQNIVNPETLRSAGAK
jgi:hypothetical protein